MKQIQPKKTVWFPLSLIATGFYIAFGQVSTAKVSSSTEAVHGHQVTITQSPIIAGSGVIAQPISIPTLPVTVDPDDDPLAGWSYQWLFNDQPVAEGISNNPTTIPSYTPILGQQGG